MSGIEYFYGEHLRLDWGLGNPNKTAAVIACLAIAAWLLNAVLQRSKTGFTISGLAFLYFGCLLTHTYSRGALLGLSLGMIPVVLWIWKKKGRYEQCLFALLLAALTGYAFHNDAAKRISPGVIRADASVANRLDIYRQVPRMLADNPHGWGLGESGKAYCHYYQKPEKWERYRSLVNYHATVLAEVPWWARILYVSGWGLLFALFLPGRDLQLLPVLGTGMALTFFTASCFSTIGETWQTWIPLMAITPLVLLWRLLVRQPPDWIITRRLLLLANLTLALTCLIGLLSPSPTKIIVPGKNHLILQCPD